ncbi:MAG: phage shock protein A [Chloroflexi bacterium]|jgi:phage shock protein A|nr:MAG: phage shock protein A [Chloroflexota bacterium]
MIFKSKMSGLLDRAEDPRQTLDYSYEKQVELLRKVKQGVVEVASSRRRLEMQAEKVRSKIPKLDDQARQAMEHGREDLARLALQRKQTALYELEGLEQQVTGVEQEQERLTISEQRLAHKVDTFRNRRESLKAQYTAAEASVKIGEALSGVSEEMADVGLAVERAEHKIESMRARSSAIDQLADSGVLDDVTLSGDSLDRELAELTAGQNVDVELEAMRRQLGSSDAKQLGDSNS